MISQHRFDPASVAVAGAIAAGELGRLTSAVASVPWWRTQEYYDAGRLARHLGARRRRRGDEPGRAHGRPAGVVAGPRRSRSSPSRPGSPTSASRSRTSPSPRCASRPARWPCCTRRPPASPAWRSASRCRARAVRPSCTPTSWNSLVTEGSGAIGAVVVPAEDRFGARRNPTTTSSSGTSASTTTSRRHRGRAAARGRPRGRHHRAGHRARRLRVGRARPPGRRSTRCCAAITTTSRSGAGL